MQDPSGAVLPAGVHLQSGPPPPPPAGFDDNYVLPEHSEKPLQALHFHPLDERLVFYERPHVYTVDGVPTSVSVTGLAHEFDQPFVAAEAIAAMKRSKRQAWPRLEFVTEPRPIVDEGDWNPALGALQVIDGQTVAAVHPHSLGEECTLDNLRTMLSVQCGRAEEGCVDSDLHAFVR